ncbi:hypothetical protein EDD29_2058 [Actinocorallia herbida]|uniref:Uncharacterized protein n=1 Tax=Actinocorallia herbida TaxID=58109 RepID=A0A3N1CTA0_9ACTN|nr:hypothetical protein EDD29_2058 [Actinocorallia herbida]
MLIVGLVLWGLIVAVFLGALGLWLRDLARATGRHGREGGGDDREGSA